MASLSVPPMSSVLRFVLIFVWCFCLGDVGAGGVGRRGPLGKFEQREFDLFKLSLQWPGTYCSRTRRCCSSNGCCHGSNKLPGFTIHGLWPDYNDGSWPSCCAGKRFDANEISTLQEGLDKYWPSLSCSSPTNCHGGKGLFWEHEWEKHGTCASSVTGDEYSYFLTTINLYLKYNVTEVLKEAGYVASNKETYPLGGIVEAIQNAFHATPELQCSSGAVQELHLCFDKNFKPRDCEAASGNACPKYVSLPEFISSEVVNVEAQDTDSAFTYR